MEKVFEYLVFAQLGLVCLGQITMNRSVKATQILFFVGNCIAVARCIALARPFGDVVKDVTMLSISLVSMILALVPKKD